MEGIRSRGWEEGGVWSNDDYNNDHGVCRLWSETNAHYYYDSRDPWAYDPQDPDLDRDGDPRFYDDWDFDCDYDCGDDDDDDDDSDRDDDDGEDDDDE